MIVEIPYGEHLPLRNEEDEPYEFELKPINGKMIRAFNLCCYCSILFEAGSHGMCLDAPVEDEDDLNSRYREIKRRHREILDRDSADDA